MNRFATPKQDSLVTAEAIQSAVDPYYITKQNSKTHLLTPAQANGLTLIIVETLMDNYTEKDGMRMLASFLNVEAYEELCNERVINHYCGYPLCPKNEPDRIKSTSNKTNLKFLQSYYNNSYCCKLHYQSNEFFKKQLSEEAIFLRTDLFVIDKNIIFLDELLDALHNKENKEKSMLEIIEDMKSLSLTSEQGKLNDLAGLVENFEIVENESLPAPPRPNELKFEDGYGFPNQDPQAKGRSIEGYVPQ